MPREKFSFHENCAASPVEHTPVMITEIGFPDENRKVTEYPCVSADGEVMLIGTGEDGRAYGQHAMKFKGVGLFLNITAEQARESGRALLTMADDLERMNGKSMVS